MRRLVTFFLVIPLLGAVALPAAAQSPTTTEELLSGMVTEEVAPGVFRVANDGVRDLGSWRNQSIVAGHDGGIWVLRKGAFFRLGTEDAHAWPNNKFRPGFHVAPDGTVWTLEALSKDDRPIVRIRSFDGEEWTLQKRAPGTEASWWHRPLEVAPDGTVWAAWSDPESATRKGVRHVVVARFGAEGWEPLGQPIEVFGNAVSLFVTESGDIWAAHQGAPSDEGGVNPMGWQLSRYVDGAWQLEGPTAEGDLAVDIGPDGTVWLLAWQDDFLGPTVGSTYRYDGTEWQGWGPTDGVPVKGDFRCWSLRVASDGGLWVSTSGDETVPCGIIGRFDGSTWQPYLTSSFPFLPGSIDIAADGSVWVLASMEGDGEGQRGVYVITPEAVAE